jgi:DnaJ domain
MPIGNNVNYYEILQISEDASSDEIKNNYRKLALLRHPDKPGGNEEDFKLLQKAYECLRDKEKREAYNKQLREDPDYPNLEDTVANWCYCLRYLYEPPAPDGVNPKSWRKFPKHRSEPVFVILLPLKRILKDLINTFKPYKSSWYQKEDAMQVLSGFNYIFIAIVTLFMALFWPLISLAVHILRIDKASLDGGLRHFISIQQEGELILSTFTHLVTGILQLATFPLNFLVRMPLRWLLTPKNKDTLSLSNTLNRLVNEFGEALNKEHSIGLYVTYRVIEQKLLNAENKNRQLARRNPEYIASKTDVYKLFHDRTKNTITVNGRLNDMQKTTLSKYLNNLKQSLSTSDESNSRSSSPRPVS